MAKIGITYEQVAFACQSLLKEGQTITARAILAKTGGSPTNILKHWQHWRKEQEDIALAAVDEELSPQIRQAILAESARKIAIVKQQLSGKIATAEQHLIEMQEMLYQADMEKDRLNSELQKAQQQMIEQDKRQAIADQRLLDAQSRCQELETRYRESALAHERAHTEKLMIEKQNQALEKRIDILEHQQQGWLPDHPPLRVKMDAKKSATKKSMAAG